MDTFKFFASSQNINFSTPSRSHTIRVIAGPEPGNKCRANSIFYGLPDMRRSTTVCRFRILIVKDAFWSSNIIFTVKMNRPLVPFIPVFTKVVPIVPNISSNIAGRGDYERTTATAYTATYDSEQQLPLPHCRSLFAIYRSNNRTDVVIAADTQYSPRQLRLSFTYCRSFLRYEFVHTSQYSAGTYCVFHRRAVCH